MGKKFVILLVVFGLLLAGCAGKNSAAAVKADLPGALNLVLGTTDKPGVFASFHIELSLDTPPLNDDNSAVVNQVTKISADVEGKNVHILQTDPGAAESKEGFIIGDTEYKLVNGEKQDTLGSIGLSWALWPLKVILPYAWASNCAKKTGTDTIGGRAADVYTFDSGNAFTAMLKLEMAYAETPNDNAGKEIGSGNGNIQLEISQVNQIRVVEP